MFRRRNCPSCGTRALVTGSEQGMLYCPNFECPARRNSSLVHFCRRVARWTSADCRTRASSSWWMQDSSTTPPICTASRPPRLAEGWSDSQKKAPRRSWRPFRRRRPSRCRSCSLPSGSVRSVRRRLEADRQALWNHGRHRRGLSGGLCWLSMELERRLPSRSCRGSRTRRRGVSSSG